MCMCVCISVCVLVHVYSMFYLQILTDNESLYHKNAQVAVNEELEQCFLPECKIAAHTCMFTLQKCWTVE